MTTEPEAIPADVLELARVASWEGTLPKEVCAYEIAHAIMADRASRAPVDGAGAKPVAWVQQKTLDALVEMSKGASSFQIANARFAAWDVPLYTHPAPASSDAEMVRPIVGIENRTAQEVFDIMSDRIRLRFSKRGGDR